MSPHRPPFDDFARRAEEAPCVPVYRQLTGDGLTPVSAFLKVGRSAPSFLFESVIGGEKVGRFSFLGSEPFLRFEARGGEVRISGGPGGDRRSSTDDPFRDLEALIGRYRAPTCRGCPGSRGAPSASPPTMRSATPSASPTPLPTTAACPTCRSPSTTGW